MKKLTFSLPILMIAFTMTVFTSCAQSSHLDRFYQQYHDSDNGIDPSFLLSASFSTGNDGRPDNADRSDNADDNGAGWMHKVKSVRCLIIDGKKTPTASREWSDLDASLRADHFEEWFSVHKGQSRIQLLSRDKDAIMEDIACVIVGDDGSGLFFHLRGHFTAADRARMEAALQSHDSE